MGNQPKQMGNSAAGTQNLDDAKEGQGRDPELDIDDRDEGSHRTGGALASGEVVDSKDGLLAEGEEVGPWSDDEGDDTVTSGASQESPDEGEGYHAGGSRHSESEKPDSSESRWGERTAPDQRSTTKGR